MHEYGRTSIEGLDATGAVPLDEQATAVWRRSPFFSMLQTGASLLRRRLTSDTKDEFSLLPEWHAAGVTDNGTPTSLRTVQRGPLSQQVNGSGTLGYVAQPDGSPYEVVIHGTVPT